MFVFRKIAQVTLGAGLLALPGIANAGSSSATGTASFKVINECSVTGSTINFGTYTTAQSWADVAADLGIEDTGYVQGKRGQEYVTWGSITCDAGTPYSLKIEGGSLNPYALPGSVVFLGNQDPPGSENYDLVVRGRQMVKKIGSTVIPDSLFPGAGTYVGETPASGIGEGVPQQVIGSLVISVPATYFSATNDPATKLVAGTYIDTLTYTLDF